jgi:citrate lyase subunit beta/citryl-CoA lyase
MTGNYSVEAIRLARSFLFVPGNRPARFSKARAAQPDIIVIDLEDSVPAADKTAARSHVSEWLAAGNPAMVRIDGAGTDWYDDDLGLVAEHRAPVMLAKAERADDIITIAQLSANPVVPLIETATGVAAAAEICAAAGVPRPAFGSIDLATELGVDPGDRDAMLMARSILVLAAAAARIASPIDGVTTAMTDLQAVTDDFSYAKRIGMTAKLCIHPAQVSAVHATAAPSAGELRWAQQIIAACDADGSAVAMDGEMVDAPVLRRARRIVSTAQRG